MNDLVQVTTVLSPVKKPFFFISPNWIWEGSALRVVLWTISPSMVLIVRVRSSAPKASKLEWLHIPQVMRLECLPIIGIFLPAWWLYKRIFPLTVPIQRWAPFLAQARNDMASLMPVSIRAVFWLLEFHIDNVELTLEIAAKFTPSESHPKPVQGLPQY